MADISKLVQLATRVYNNKMIHEVNEKGEVIQSDEKDIEMLINKTFNSGSPSPEKLHQFNEVVVKQAELVAEPKLETMLNLFANYDNVADGTVKILKFPKIREKAQLLYTANGVGVDYVRISQDIAQKPAVPMIMSVGASYELSDFSSNAVEAFNNVVDTVADSLVRFYYDEMVKIIAVAVANGDIPAPNCASGANLGLAEYKKAENTMIRLGGGRPVFIADSVLIEALAVQQLNVASGKDNLATDDLKDALREELYISKLSKSVAVNLVNPFIDDKHVKVAFPTNEGYLFPAGSNAKPIEITKYGGLKQFSEFDIETEKVLLKIKIKTSIDLINAKRIGVIKDTAIS